LTNNLSATSSYTKNDEGYTKKPKDKNNLHPQADGRVVFGKQNNFAI